MNEDIRFQPKELEWTPEKIARFWDYEGQNLAKVGEYFTKQVGDALIDLARSYGALAEPVLDYGAGPGHLTEKLVLQGLVCDACDFSPVSLEALKKRLASHASFRDGVCLSGLPSALPAEGYGTVFLAETMEHLLPGWREKTLQEIYRVLRWGGFVVVTVPHAENLQAAQVMCPECGAIFHRVQHVAAFDCRTLENAMVEQGFKKVACHPIDLVRISNEMQAPWRRFQRLFREALGRVRVLSPRPSITPNLVYVGRKA